MDIDVQRKYGILYPMLVTAAVSAIIFSAFGVASLTGQARQSASTLSDVMLDKRSAVPRDVVGDAFGCLTATELHCSAYPCAASGFGDSTSL